MIEPRKISRKWIDLPGEGIDVFADALVGVVDLAVGAQRVVLAPLQVAIEETPGEPAPPLVGEQVAHVVVEGVARHRERQDQQAGAHRGPEAAAIFSGQRRRHLAGLVVQHDGQLGFDQHQARSGARAGTRPALFPPSQYGFATIDELLPSSERQEC
jgi:hypothetical protein